MGVTETVDSSRTSRPAVPGRLRALLRPPTRTTMRRLAGASLVANILLVVTGGAVRLTGSGLGCPTWPRCTDGSFVAHEALGGHGYIEFGNRLLTFLLVVIAITTWVVAMRLHPARRSIRWLATGLLLGIPVQAAVGGVSVLTDLNPWVVSFHLLASLALVSTAVVLLRRVDEEDRPARPTVPRPVVLLTRALLAVTALVLYVGTVVTGSGPHAGDQHSPRNGLTSSTVSQLHADLVFLLVGLTVGAWLALRAAGAPERAQRAARLLLGLEVAQGAIGFLQYATDLPVILVGLHMLGAALIAAAATWLALGLRDRGRQCSPPPSNRGGVTTPAPTRTSPS